MKAYDELSQRNLELAAQALCKTEDERGLLQEIYELGVADGQIMQLRGQIANKEAA